MNKAMLRKVMLEKRGAISETQRLAGSQAIAETIIDYCAPFRVIACYVSFQAEVSTEYLLSQLLRKHDVVVPRVLNKEQMEFVHINADTSWKTGRYKIQEPSDGEPIELNQIDCFIIPMLAFDRQGNRLGYGGGYYDRILATSDACKIGIAFDEQIIDDVYAETWDIPLDVIITPTQTIHLTSEEPYS